ncbi:MAG: porin [Candidatus Zixiibacteriota bacterium]
MSKVLLFLFCFPPLLFSFGFGEDKADELEVRSTSPELLEIEPGTTVTGSFLVYNKGEHEEQFSERLTLPAGWQKIVSSESLLKLKSKEKQVSLAAFFVPATASAGRYQVGYGVQSQGDSSITGSDTMWVTVLPLVKLEILIEESPEAVTAGESYQVGLRVLNGGNCTVPVGIRTKSIPDCPVEIEPGRAILAAGQSQRVRLKAKTNEKWKQLIRQSLEITAQTEDPSVGVRSVERTVWVQVVPKVTPESDGYHRLPAQMTLISAGQDGKRGLQVEFSGRGDLDGKGRQRMDFLLRGPDIQDRSAWGKRDEYQVTYLSPHFDLHLGDGSYSLSPLTERFHYGRGGELGFRWGKMGWGAFHLQNRWGRPKSTETGTYLLYHFGEGLDIKGNFLLKSKGSTFPSRNEDSRLYSLQAGIKPNERIKLDLECGLSQPGEQDDLNHLAFRIDLSGRLANQIQYSFEQTHAEPDYFGYYNDSDFANFTLTFPIFRELRGSVCYHSDKNNLDLDSTKYTADRERSYQYGMSYGFGSGTHVSADYQRLTKADRILPSGYDYRERTLKLGFSQSLGRFSLSAHVERGECADKVLAIKSEHLERFNLYAHFRPSYRQTYTLYASFGDDSFSAIPQRAKSVGISSSWLFKNRVSLGLDYRRDQSDAEGGGERSHLLCSLNCTLLNSHVLALRGQWSEHELKGENGYAFLATYTVPLEIPVSRRKDTGVLQGRVFDQEKPTRPPISRVILTAGGTTSITNEKGEFCFSSLDPGICYLQVEKCSIGPNRVTGERLPLKLEVKGGKTKAVEIGLVRACKISGRVAVFSLSPSNESDHKDAAFNDSLCLVGSGKKDRMKESNTDTGRGLGNALVEISDGQETLRERTDQKGRFSFGDMRPGKWTMKVYSFDLPPQHYLEKEEFPLELGPGEEKEVVARVLPHLRQIQMIDEGEIKEENK